MKKKTKRIILWVLGVFAGLIVLLVIFFFLAFNGYLSWHRFRPKMTGVVCDYETRQPLEGVALTFICDTLVSGADPDMRAINEGQRLETNKHGEFKIKKIVDMYTRHRIYWGLSAVLEVSHEGYVPDTLNLRQYTNDKRKYRLDTIWLKPFVRETDMESFMENDIKDE